MKRERIQIAKVLGILFGSLTVFYVGYFIWSILQYETNIYQMISRGTQMLVVAYITYAIHSEIRGRVRYVAHDKLYRAVDSKMADDAISNKETARIGTVNVYTRPGDDPRDFMGDADDLASRDRGD